MIKCKIYIFSGNDFLDEKVCVEISLPCAPFIGSYLQLGDELKTELENKAKSSVNTALKYAPKWFYFGSKNVGAITDENLKDLSFADALYVSSVTFKANQDILFIELTDTDITGISENEK